MEKKASKTAQIIDAQGFAVKGAFVLVDFIPSSEPSGELTYLESIHGGQVLQSGESLIYGGAAPTDMVKPRWTGSEWEETATPEELAAAAYRKLQAGVNEADPGSVTHEQVLEHIRNQKLAMVGTACEAAIYSGTKAMTSEGEKHFSLQTHDQTELIGLKPQLDQLIAAGDVETPAIPYHADGELCRLWPAADFGSILQTATGYIFGQRTYCNHLNAWIRREDDLDTLQAITYGAELPQDLAEHMQAILAAGEGAQEA